jgi:DNA topoisomerase I
LKPRRSSLPEGVKPERIDLEGALKLLSLPRDLGETSDGLKIVANNGRFGPYISVGPTFVSLKEPYNVFDISQEQAISLYESSGKKAIALGMIGKFPATVNKGRYGYYIAYKREKYALPKGTDPETVTLELAQEIIASKSAKASPKAPAKRKTTKK